MAIFVSTYNPNELVQEIKKAIDDRSIISWSYDSDGDFTQTSEQWRSRSWIRPRIEVGRVVFGIVDRTDCNLSVEEYAVFHGRFVEMLLENFDKKCSEIKVSPLATNYDIIKEK